MAIKVASYFKRKAGMSVEDFQRYWRTQHAEVVQSLPNLQRYVQNHVLAASYAQADPPFDGVAEVWFESIEVMQANAGHPALAQVREDEANFIDGASMSEMLCSEHVVKVPEPGVPAVKLMALVKRRDDVTLEDFKVRYGEVLADMVCRIPDVAGYIQAYCRAGAYRDGAEPPFDVLASLFLADAAALTILIGSEAMAAVREYEVGLFRMDSIRAAVVREVPVV